MINIRDPIHGTLSVTGLELQLIDHALFQRLRNVKQLGFADLAFPGATHTRYSHSLGAMHLATRLFDVLFGSDGGPVRRGGLGAPEPLPAAERARFRQAVRLAVLFHDVGHAPLSHTTELIMPGVRQLGIPGRPVEDRQATHEDYTLKILLDSDLARALSATFMDAGITPAHVADLISPDHAQPSPWTVHGLDYGPILRQLASSELDADRMDYLQRDSFYSGVNYGKFDADWLIQNVMPVVQQRRVHLGVAARAMFSFEDFLLSRYHMFLTVYYHHTPVCFGEMLARYFATAPGEYVLPADVDQYVQHDDMALWSALRQSKNPWAVRICARRAFRLVKDDSRSAGAGWQGRVEQLNRAGIEAFEHTSKGVLSKYFQQPDVAPIYVVEDDGTITPIESYTPLYKRYADTVKVWRLYVAPEHADRAWQVLGGGS